jgi:hypothetical protein
MQLFPLLPPYATSTRFREASDESPCWCFNRRLFAARQRRGCYLEGRGAIATMDHGRMALLPAADGLATIGVRRRERVGRVIIDLKSHANNEKPFFTY